MNKTDGLLLNKIDTLSYEKMFNMAYLSALPWVFSPLIIMLLNFFGLSGYNVTSIWIVLLYFSGGAGLILGLIYFSKVLFFSDVKFAQLLKCYEPLLILFIFALWCIFCTLFAEEKRIAIYGYATSRDNLFTYLFYGGMIILGIILMNSNNLLLRLAKTHIYVSAIIAIVGFQNNSFSKRLIANDFSSGERYCSIFYEQSHYGLYLLLSLLLCVFVFLNSVGFFEKLLHFFVFSLLAVMVCLNGCAITIVALTLSLFFSLIFLRSSVINSKHSIAFLVTLFIVIVTVMMSLFGTRFSMLNATDNVSQSVVTNVDSFQSSGESYLLLWHNALRFIVANSVVGIGPQNTLARYKDSYLQLALYVGLPGLLLYLFSFATALRSVLNGMKYRHRSCACALILLFSFLVFIFFDNSIFYCSAYFYFVFGVLIGFGATVLDKVTDDENFYKNT